MKNRALNNRVWIKGLIVECPLGIPLRDCPLNGLRSLPLRQINSIVNGLPKDKLNELMAAHRECYNHRQKQIKYPVL